MQRHIEPKATLMTTLKATTYQALKMCGRCGGMVINILVLRLCITPSVLWALLVVAINALKTGFCEHFFDVTIFPHTFADLSKMVAICQSKTTPTLYFHIINRMTTPTFRASDCNALIL